MKTYMSRMVVAMAMTALCLSASLQAAETISFSRLSGNSDYDISDQLGLNIDQSGGKVLFTLTNNVGMASNVAEIYFYTRTGSDFSGINLGIDSQVGSTFQTGKVSPGDLPELKGSEYDVFSVRLFSADSDVNGPNSKSDGLDNAADRLVMWMTGADYDSVVNAFKWPGADLLVGLHVRSLPDGESDAYITAPPTTVVPAPGAIVLAGIGTMLVGWLRRRESI